MVCAERIRCNMNYSILSMIVVAIVICAVVLRFVWSAVKEGAQEGLSEFREEQARDKADKAVRDATEASAQAKELATFTAGERRAILLQAMFTEFHSHGPLVSLAWTSTNIHWLRTYRIPADKYATVRDALSREWGVDGRESLIKVIEWLLKEGHRTEIDEMFDYAELDDETLDDALKRKGLRAVAAARAAGERVGTARGAGFDLARAAMLTSNGMALGYLNVDEGRAMLAACDLEARRFCDSWRQFGESFLAGGDIWMQMAGVMFAGLTQKWWRLTIDWLLVDPLSPWGAEPWGEEPGLNEGSLESTDGRLKTLH